MASIKDSLEETVQDVNATLKFLIFAIPLFYTILLATSSRQPSFYPYLLTVTILLMFGFMLKCTYNLRRGEPRILPGFNVFDIVFTGLKGAIALAPLIIVAVLVATTLNGILSKILNAEAHKITTYVVNVICASFAATGYLLYAKSFKIFDAYNVGQITKHCADVILAVFFMFLQLAIIDTLLVAPVTYVIWLFFGLPHPLALFFWCMVGVLNFAMSGHYLAQVDYEIIELNKDEILDAELKFANKK